MPTSKDSDGELWGSGSYQCHQVPGVLATEVSAAAEHDQRHEEDGVGHVIRPGVTAHKHLGVIHEGEDGHKGGGHHQLHSQDHEHLRGYSKEVVHHFIIAHCVSKD